MRQWSEGQGGGHSYREPSVLIRDLIALAAAPKSHSKTRRSGYHGGQKRSVASERLSPWPICLAGSSNSGPEVRAAFWEGQMAQARVLHVLKKFQPDFTGEGVFAERIAPVMDMLAPCVEHEMLATVTPRPEQGYGGSSALRKVHYICPREGLAHWQQELRQVWWFLRHLHRYQVVHIRTHSDRYFITYLLAKLFGKRLIISATLDDSIPGLVKTYRPLLRPLALRLFRLFDAFVAISPRLHRETKTVMVAGRCHLVPVGIIIPPLFPQEREGRRAALGLASHDLVLVFVGGICKRKDPLFLVEQLPKIVSAHPHALLLVIGPILEPDYHRQMVDRIEALGMERHVRFIGRVPDATPYLGVADLFTFTSKIEGFGTAVIEAMANALPVVVRELPGVNDVFIENGENGFYFKKDEEFIFIVKSLIDNPELRIRVGMAARASVSARFAMRTIAARYLEIYGVFVDDAQPMEKELAPDTLARVEALPAAIPITTSDARRHICSTPDDLPVVLTIIDAEEEFDWSQPFSRHNTSTHSMAAQVLAHQIYDRYGVVPVYLIDHAVASTPESITVLNDLLQDGRCDIGAQLHPWVTPPFLEEVNNRNSFACNLPLALQYEKIASLTETIHRNFGAAPQIFRTGRYGLGLRTGDILKSLGYRVDTSVFPYRDYTPIGGTNFYGCPTSPYWLDTESTLLEIPVTCSVVGRLRRYGPRLAPLAFSSAATRLHLPGLLARAGLLERINLSPEGTTLHDARRLVKSMIQAGQRVFTVTYHSPSLAPGNTPYVRDGRDLARFLEWLDGFYAFFVGELGGVPVRWQQVYETASPGRLSLPDFAHAHRQAHSPCKAVEGRVSSLSREA